MPEERPKKPPEITIYEGWAAAAKLGSMGLDLEKMIEIVRRGERARAESTLHDPVIAGAIDAWRFRVRGLRDEYAPIGWTVSRPHCVEILLSPDGHRAILTRAGDAGVGIRGGDPQPKRELGGGTIALVETGISPSLFGAEWLQAQDVKRPEFEMWMFLVYASSTVIRSELSLGVETKSGRVSRWFERILLPELEPGDLSKHRSTPDDADSLAPDVPIIRKRSA